MNHWYEKHRPLTVDDYVWTDEQTKQKLIDWIENPLDYPHLLIPGTTGTGKTTLAKIIRKILEDDGRATSIYIPASLRSGVDTIREEIVNFCEVGGFRELKLVIMDEADRMSRDAQEMMRNVMDRYQGDVRFIFTCNYLPKIIEPVRGRMLIVPIQALDEEQFSDRLLEIVTEEDVDVSSDASMERLEAIIRENYPNMRKAITELQMSVYDGVLVAPTNGAGSAIWEEALLGTLENFNIHDTREMVVSIPPTDFEHAYRVLYENSEIFGDNEQDAVLLIADHLYRHSQAGLPDITLCSCLIQLSEFYDG